MAKATDRTEEKFTAGPWSTNGSHIYAPDGEIIAVVHNPGSSPSDYPLIGNRSLIAAAPDLYAALTEMLADYEPLPLEFFDNKLKKRSGKTAREGIALARAALTKAVS